MTSWRDFQNIENVWDIDEHARREFLRFVIF